MKIFFAPLQGYTEDAYRRLHHEMIGGVEEYYTPFIRLEHGELRSKDMRDVRLEFNEGVPVVPQVIASNGDEMQHLLDYLLPLGYKRIDVNMGCPFPLQTRHGRGAGILTDTIRVQELCDVIRSHADVAFSVKMRLGMNDKNDWREVLPLLNDTPLEHITLHPRVASQQYKGDVDMEAFAAFAQECRHPLIYNGEINSRDQAEKIMTLHPDLKGLMIGRGLLARPVLAKECTEGVTCTDREVLTLIKEMHQRLLAHYEKVIPGEAQRHSKIKTFWDFMEPTIGRKPWKKIIKAGNMKNYLEAVYSS